MHINISKRAKMVTTNDKIICWWLTNRKQKTFFYLLDTSLLPWWKQVMYPPKWCSHNCEDILTKMIKKFPLTLNFFWVLRKTLFKVWTIVNHHVSVHVQMDIMHLFLMQCSPSLHVIGVYLMCASSGECNITKYYSKNPQFVLQALELCNYSP